MIGSYLYNTIRSHVYVRLTRLLLHTCMVLMCLDVQAGSDLPDSLQTLLDRATTDSARIRAHIRIANALTNTNYKKSLEHATWAVRLSEKTGERSAMIESYKLAGSVSMYKGLYDLAVNFFNKHYDLAKRSGDEIEAGMAYHNLGAVYLALEDHGKAKKFVNDSYKMLEAGYKQADSSLPSSVILAYQMNMSIIHLYQGDFKASDSMLTAALSLVRVMPDREARLMTIYHIRALLDLKTRKPSDALASLKASRDIALRLQNIPGVAITYISEGEAFEQLQNIDAAKRAYSQGIFYAKQYNGLSDQMINAEGLYKIYRKTGPSDSTVKYFELFSKLKEQSAHLQAKEELMRTELKRGYDQMLNDLKHEQQSAKRKVLTLTLLLSFVTAFAFFIRYRGRQRSIRLERARRDLEERKAKYEQLRLEAELGDRDAELERVKQELEKYTFIEGLVGGLDNIKQSKSSEKDRIKGSKGTTASDMRQKAWEEFELRFQQMHNGFYDRLSQRYPNLSMNERRLCAFLLLDMTTKEISDITGQSVTALNMARIRLRNKLGLTHTDKELYSFLSEL